ncbi:MAG: hypothetical protein R3174_09935 [Gammaproteobacteria bacterium]|nr:hypothetical protein [Gammaproteobacteria bacterium]
MSVVLAISTWPHTRAAAEILLVVQTERRDAGSSFAPLGDYLTRVVSEKVRVEVRHNPLVHWRALISGERPALVLEDPHFADYRISRSGYRIAAAIDGVQSFIVAVGGLLLLDPGELAGQPVAALSPPSLSTMQFLSFFSDPVRTPRLIEAATYRDAAAQVIGARALAAVLPSTRLREFSELTGALALEDLPAQALLVSPDLDEGLYTDIGAALLNAAGDEQGRWMLEAIGVRGFIRSHPEAYEGLSRLLKGTWGYRNAAP